MAKRQPSKSKAAKSQEPSLSLPTKDVGLTDLFLPYQKRWIADPARLKIAEKGRQLGFTWIEAFWSVLRGLSVEIDHYFVSADEEQAKRFIEDCRDWYQKITGVAQLLSPKFESLDLGKTMVGRLVMPPLTPGRDHGRQIIALSSNPKAIRGKRGDVTLDEYAFHEKAEEMWRAAQACARWGDGKQPGHLHVISTHNGPATEYKKLIDKARAGDNDFSLHRVTLYDAVSEGLADKVPGTHRDSFSPGDTRNKTFIRNCRRECLNEDHFAQEHLCEPMSASSVIKPHEYDNCRQGTVPDRFDPSKKYGELFVGVDIGRSQDLTVIWVLEKGFIPAEKRPELLDEFRSVYRTVSVTTLQNMKIPDQYDVLRPILSHPSLCKCRIDMGTVGRVISDQAETEFGWLIEPVAMNRDVKHDCAETLRGFVQQKRIGLPHAPRIKDDLCSMKVCISDKGVVTYEGSTTWGHCDAFWACGLAITAAEGDRPQVRMFTKPPTVKQQPSLA